MNREIKFRAYHSKHDWIYFVIKPTPENRDQTISFGSAIGRQMLQEGLTRWGQFTGLKDKNGSEVFEGDIVRDEEGKKFEVLYRVGAFMIERQMHPDFGDDDKGWQFTTLQDCSDGDETLREHEVIENSAPLEDTEPNTQCTSACGNDYDCPHEEESDTETV